MADVVKSLTYRPLLSGVLTADVAIDGVTNPDLTIAIATTILGTLSPSTTPIAITKIWGDTGQLAAGAATIDLTALARGNLPAVNLTGLTVKAILIYNYPTNTAALRVADGATNGYDIFGAATGDITIPAGWYQLFGAHNVTGVGALQAVGASDKTIDLSSTDVDASYDILIAA